MGEYTNPRTWSLVVASNSDEILQNNLLRSAPAKLAKEIFVDRNPYSASQAYNRGLDKCTSDIIVFAHQDVYLPPMWAETMLKVVEYLSTIDSSWGVAGLYGVTETGEGIGHVYSTGLRQFVGKAFTGPVQVRTIDEMVIILRRSAELCFDAHLPGFHLYATDICLEAESRGLQNYVLPCFALHNSNGIKYLPYSFWQAYLYLRKKWKKRLPIVTPCTTISYGCIPIIRHLLTSFASSIRGRKKIGSRVVDSERFYAEHLIPVLKSTSNS